MLRVGICVPFGLGVLLGRVTFPGREAVMERGGLWGEQSRAAFQGVPGGSTADVGEPGAGT